MNSEAKIIISDLGALGRMTAQLVAIISGAIGMVATGTLLTGLALGKVTAGIDGFYNVMELRGFGVNHPILHTTLVGMNWIVLIGLFAYLLKESLLGYRQSVLSRAVSVRVMANARSVRKEIRPMREMVMVDKASNS